MSPTIAKVLQNQQQEIAELRAELKKTKQRLQYTYTTVNDLRYTKRQLLDHINTISREDRV